jgi:predicted nuclease of restriction endonuclease-like (RecB) superfamily
MKKEKKTKNVPVNSSEKDAISIKEYSKTLADLKHQIQESQFKAAAAVNHELIYLYWKIGKTIAEKQEKSGWGTKVIEKLAKDLQNAFPGINGFSRTNIFRMRAFYHEYKLVPPVVGQFNEFEHLGVLTQIPWSHNIILMEKLDSIEQRLWYATKTIENRWGKRALEDWIDKDIYSRQGKAVTNFSLRLPEPQSTLAKETLCDPYFFEFLNLPSGYLEKELEDGLVEKIQQTLLAFGHGFAFVGRQYPLEVDGDTYYIDLLFYHIPSHRYIAVELKTEHFKPEHTGQMNFYLAAIDDMLKTNLDNPSIGLILCKRKSKIKAEYALRDINKLMSVAEYSTANKKILPKTIDKLLPTIKQIEAELEKESL